MRKRHPGYKDSDIEWLREIPEHWQLMRVKNLMSNPVIRSNGSSLPFIALEDIESNTGDTIPSFVWEEKTIEDAEIFMPGDVLFTKLRPYLRKYILADRKGCCQTELLVLHPISDLYLPAYLYYAIQTHYFISLADSTSYGVKMPRTSWDKLNQHCLQVPSIDEQQEIIDFLYKAKIKINTLIAKKEKQIELLKEKRAAVITRAVTKGLDPNVPMKDSGVEWLGEIPVHWEAKKIKRLTAVKRGASPRPIDDPKYFDIDGEFAWVRISDVSASDKYLESTEQQLSSLGSSLSIKQNPGDLFLSIAATVGKPIISKIKCCIHDGFVWFPNLKLNREYLYYMFETGSPFHGLGKLGTQLNLNTDTIGDIFIPLPPTSEIEAIVKYISTEAMRIDLVISKIKSSIDKLKEYRTALISAAVTGKIDVRGE